MKMNGGVAKADLGAENVDAVKAGCANLGRHIENLKSFGVPVVVAINHFVTDTDAEVQAVKDYRRDPRVRGDLSQHWEIGSEGLRIGTQRGRDCGSRCSHFAPIYPDEMSLVDKIETIAKTIYRADEVMRQEDPRSAEAVGRAGVWQLPVCMAKTQYSFSTDPNLRGAPTGFICSCARSAFERGCRFRCGCLW